MRTSKSLCLIMATWPLPLLKLFLEKDTNGSWPAKSRICLKMLLLELYWIDIICYFSVLKWSIPLGPWYQTLLTVLYILPYHVLTMYVFPYHVYLLTMPYHTYLLHKLSLCPPLTRDVSPGYSSVHLPSCSIPSSYIFSPVIISTSRYC